MKNMDIRNQYMHTKISRVVEHNDNLRTFIFEDGLDSIPGQFAMVWLPGIDEKPISLSGISQITVRKVGPFTEKLFEKKEGDYLDIRGPYGNGFPQTGGNIIIGGGCGIAPLLGIILDKKTSVSKIILAGKTKSDIPFLEEIIKKTDSELPRDSVVITTDDGSYGTKGLVTDINIPVLDHNYFICGPEIMMKKVAEKLMAENMNPRSIYLSLERYMKCAIGLCGNCSFGGYRVCADGPVFRYDQIKDLPHFSEMHRTRTGELVRK